MIISILPCVSNHSHLVNLLNCLISYHLLRAVKSIESVLKKFTIFIKLHLPQTALDSKALKLHIKLSPTLIRCILSICHRFEFGYVQSSTSMSSVVFLSTRLHGCRRNELIWQQQLSLAKTYYSSNFHWQICVTHTHTTYEYPFSFHI